MRGAVFYGVRIFGFLRSTFGISLRSGMGCVALCTPKTPLRIRHALQ
jgi:hypothetical protein